MRLALEIGEWQTTAMLAGRGLHAQVLRHTAATLLKESTALG